MVTESLAKHYHGECCKKYLSLGEREGGRARPWSSDFGGLTHIHKHTHRYTHLCSCCSWWKVSIWQFAGHTHVVAVSKDVTLANNCLQHFCYLIFAELTGWGNYTTLLLVPCHLVSQAGRDSEGFSLASPLSHGMEGSATLHITFHQLLEPQFFRAALQEACVK